MSDPPVVGSIEKLIAAVRQDYRFWNTSTLPWFRGEPRDTEDPLVPKLLMGRNIGNERSAGRWGERRRLERKPTQHR